VLAFLSRKTFRVLVCAGSPWLALTARAEPPAASPAEVATWIADLDSDQYTTREQTFEKLRAETELASTASSLRTALEAALVSPTTSHEARLRLRSLLSRLPATSRPTPPRVSDAELAEQLDALRSSSFAIRSGAAARLQWWAEEPGNAQRLLWMCKARLRDEAATVVEQRALADAMAASRTRWLLSDPALWTVPEVSDADLAELVRAAAADRTTGDPRQTARRQAWGKHELMDLLAFDELLPRIKAALERGLGERSQDSEARQRLEALLDGTRPAMVAEIWSNRRLVTVQNLIVGRPQHVEGAERPTHFDAVDEHSAHCVSGNSLLPGDYRVGIALTATHPDAQPLAPRSGNIFHLVNLPTPSRRLRYRERSRLEEPRLLVELSERTCRAFLDDKRLLSERDLIILWHLDPAVVSRFASTYLATVEDQPPSEPGLPRPSRNAQFCILLAEMGTQEAAPGLLAAIREERFHPSLAGVKFQFPLIAALSIAARDPWPEVDAWLLEQIEQPWPLVREPGEEPLEAGAAAAAILAHRHGQAPEGLGLVEVENDHLAELGCRVFRFSPVEGREPVLAWWRGREQAGAAPEAPPAAAAQPEGSTSPATNDPFAPPSR
jgi:hypothetical protein